MSRCLELTLYPKASFWISVPRAAWLWRYCSITSTCSCQQNVCIFASKAGTHRPVPVHATQGMLVFTCANACICRLTIFNLFSVVAWEILFLFLMFLELPYLKKKHTFDSCVSVHCIGYESSLGGLRKFAHIAARSCPLALTPPFLVFTGTLGKGGRAGGQCLF